MPVKNKDEHILGLEDYVSTEMQHTLDCCVCCAVLQYDSIPLREFADEAYAAGWRIGVSKKLKVKGAMCPQCFALPDEERK